MRLRTLALSLPVLVSQCESPHAAHETARSHLQTLQQAASLYQIQHRGRCPLDLDALREDTVKSIPLDPWARPYRLTCTSSERAFILSAGPDRRFATEDDLRSDDSTR